jgi:hypothetical protein
VSGPRLSIIPGGAVFDRSLEPRDLHVLTLLGCYTDKSGWCRRSQVKMAKQLACGRSSVQRSLDRLVEAGWVEKKRPAWANAEGQPSNSYEYRVILDRDDAPSIVADDDDSDDADSHAQDAIPAEDCPPVGTPRAQPDGHPGAQPYVGTGAQPYVGTKNDPLERPLVERERDARARDRIARFLADFEKRWPTAAVDDRQRTAYAAEALTESEQQAALSAIGAYLDHAKRAHRKHVPAGWKYLEERRWTLLEQPDAQAASVRHYRDSIQAKALIVLHDIAGKGAFFHQVYVRDIGITYGKPVTPQLAALAQAGPKDSWPVLNRQQAGAWEGLLRDNVLVQARQRLVEGSRAPWPWPPRKDGTLSTAPPETVLMTEDDMNNFKV